MIDIDAEFEKFFEFPTDDRSTVSSVSCKLFARHMIDMQQVKPLEWVLQDRFHHAVRQNYKVSAEPTRIGYSVYYRGGLLGRAMSVTDAKQLAQDDLKKRVLGNLVHGVSA